MSEARTIDTEERTSALEETRLHVAYGASKTSTALTIVETTLPALAHQLSQHRRGEKDGPYFIPAKFREPIRKAENLATWSGLVLDIDRQVSEEELREKLAGLQYIAHSTYTEGRARVFLPYSQPISQPRHAKVAAHFVELLEADNCSNKNMQFYYLPACPEDATPWSFHTLGEGEFLNPANIYQAPQPGNLEGFDASQVVMRGNLDTWWGDFTRGEDLHGNAVKIAAHMAQKGESAQEILAQFHAMRDQVVAARGEKRAADLYDSPELWALIASGIEKYAPTAIDEGLSEEQSDRLLALRERIKQPARLVTYSGGELMDMEHTAPTYVIDRYLPRGHLTLFSGHGGSGKSTLALIMAAHVAAGESFAGRRTDQGRVLIYSLEDDAGLVSYRMSKIAQVYGIDPQRFRDQIVLVDGAQGGDPSLAKYNRDGQLLPTLPMAELLAQVPDYDLVIIDNASDAYSGEEGNRNQVGDFLRLLADHVREPRGAIMLLSHIDKHAARYGSNEQSFSGSTAWHNRPRSRLALLVEEDGSVTLKQEKLNLGPREEPQAFVFHDGIPMPRSQESLLELREVEKDYTDLIPAFRLANNRKQYVWNNLTPGAYSAMSQLRAVKSALPARYLGTGRQSNELFQEAIGWLLDQEYLMVDEVTKKNRTKADALVLTPKAKLESKDRGIDAPEV